MNKQERTRLIMARYNGWYFSLLKMLRNHDVLTFYTCLCLTLTATYPTTSFEWFAFIVVRVLPFAVLLIQTYRLFLFWQTNLHNLRTSKEQWAEIKRCLL